ncbi:uncharacterized protein LOC122251292 [Penaeus japonicus]|uniref:uncharacterized protein LOC122251292 n=1 Tax=Penaeus japonicus TaxID=27405 RepID=UPI001C70C6D8|nr:uncharacterized protein LOC122251292 [Penaeus japonicus]
MKSGLAPTLLIVFSLLASALAELQDGQDQHEQRSCVAKGGTCVKNLCQTPLAGGECEAGETCCEKPENNNAESEAGETREKRGAGGSSGGNPSPDKGSGGSNGDKGQRGTKDRIKEVATKIPSAGPRSRCAKPKEESALNSGALVNSRRFPYTNRKHV